MGAFVDNLYPNPWRRQNAQISLLNKWRHALSAPQLLSHSADISFLSITARVRMDSKHVPDPKDSLSVLTSLWALARRRKRVGLFKHSAGFASVVKCTSVKKKMKQTHPPISRKSNLVQMQTNGGSPSIYFHWTTFCGFNWPLSIVLWCCVKHVKEDVDCWHATAEILTL